MAKQPVKPTLGQTQPAPVVETPVVKTQAPAVESTTQETITETPTQETASESTVGDTTQETQEAPAAPEQEPAPEVKTEVVQEPTPEVAPAPVVETPVVAAAQLAFNPPVEAPVSSNESILLQNIRAELADYAANMGSSVPQTIETAAKHQHRLYQIYTKLFNLDAVEFKVAMDLVVSLFKENESGAFGEARVFRAAEMLPLAKTQQRMFFHLTHLFIKAGEVGTGAAGRETDLNGLAQVLPSEQARQWLLQYFR